MMRPISVAKGMGTFLTTRNFFWMGCMESTKENQKRDWSRFERAVDVALKTPAKHKAASRKRPKKQAKAKAG
jgi:hypothetical protein